MAWMCASGCGCSRFGWDYSGLGLGEFVGVVLVELEGDGVRSGVLRNNLSTALGGWHKGCGGKGVVVGSS